MRAAAVAVLALGLAACGATPGAQVGNSSDLLTTVTLVETPLQVGDVVVETFASSNETLLTTADGRTIVDAASSGQMTKRTTVEILAVQGDAPTKVKVTFDEFSGRKGGKQRTSPLTGQTFIVVMTDGKASATRADGAAVDPALLALLASETHQPRGNDPIARLYFGRAWRPATWSELSPSQMSAAEEMVASSATRDLVVKVRLRDASAQQATFEMQVTASTEAGGTTIPMRASSVATFDRQRGRALSLTSTIEGGPSQTASGEITSLATTTLTTSYRR